MEPSIGMQGTFDFEFIGDFFYQFFTLPSDFVMLPPIQVFLLAA